MFHEKDLEQRYPRDLTENSLYVKCMEVVIVFILLLGSTIVGLGTSHCSPLTSFKLIGKKKVEREFEIVLYSDENFVLLVIFFRCERFYFETTDRMYSISVYPTHLKYFSNSSDRLPPTIFVKFSNA